MKLYYVQYSNDGFLSTDSVVSSAAKEADSENFIYIYLPKDELTITPVLASSWKVSSRETAQKLANKLNAQEHHNKWRVVHANEAFSWMAEFNKKHKVKLDVSE